MIWVKQPYSRPSILDEIYSYQEYNDNSNNINIKRKNGNNHNLNHLKPVFGSHQMHEYNRQEDHDDDSFNSHNKKLVRRPDVDDSSGPDYDYDHVYQFPR